MLLIAQALVKVTTQRVVSWCKFGVNFLPLPLKDLYFLERGFDRASKSGKFLKESKRMAPVLGINTASCC